MRAISSTKTPCQFDVLVGINLLREGLDIPEVSLVAVLDADKKGFLRSDRSLIQTIGRASRHVNGRVILHGANPRFKVAETAAEYANQSPATLMKKIKQLEQAMYRHARDLEFEEAAKLRDEIQCIQQFGLGLPAAKTG